MCDSRFPLNGYPRHCHPRSRAPNSHVWLNNPLRSDFIFTVKVSSVSSILPRPPTGCCSQNQRRAVSLHKLPHSTAACLEISKLARIWPCEKCFITRRSMKQYLPGFSSCIYQDCASRSLVEKLQSRRFYVFGTTFKPEHHHSTRHAHHGARQSVVIPKNFHRFFVVFVRLYKPRNSVREATEHTESILALIPDHHRTNTPTLHVCGGTPSRSMAVGWVQLKRVLTKEDYWLLRITQTSKQILNNTW